MDEPPPEIRPSAPTPDAPRAASGPARPGPPLEDDADALVARARAGDESAFARLYRIHGPLVHGVLLARVPPHEADDLVQEVFLAAWRGLDRLAEPRALPGWLAVVARRAAARSHRRAAGRPGPLPPDLPDTRARPEDDRSEAILSELRALPEAYRETLALRLVEGLSGRAIADATGLSPDSVRTNLSRGTRLLRERLLRRGLT